MVEQDLSTDEHRGGGRAGDLALGRHEHAAAAAHLRDSAIQWSSRRHLSENR